MAFLGTHAILVLEKYKAVSFEDGIHVFGGKSDQGRIGDANEVYHIRTNQNI
jgi:hypothetical protein